MRSKTMFVVTHIAVRGPHVSVLITQFRELNITEQKYAMNRPKGN